MVMAEGGYGVVSAPPSGHTSVSGFDLISLVHGSAPDTRTMNPRASRRNVCPQKDKQDSHDYIARRPRDVGWVRAARPLLVRLQGDVAHDVPLLL
jgi:hypothetical protein